MLDEPNLKAFLPIPLGGNGIAVLVGSDPTVEHGIFGNINAEEFAFDAAPLRAVNDVYARADLDEAELASWPRDVSVPASLQ